MKSIKSFTYVLAGLGLSTTLFLGCQDMLSQNGGSNKPTITNPTTQDLSLRLLIKDTGVCSETKHRIVTGDWTGPVMGLGDSAFMDSTFRDSAFASNCLLMVHGGDTSKFVPPDSALDGKTRCGWVRTEIIYGSDEMTLKFRHYCPDDCDTLLDRDFAGRAKYCRDPKHDTLPPKNICDSLRLFMSQTTPGTQIHKKQEADFKLRCVDPVHDTSHVRPPTHDTVIAKRPVCDTVPVKPPEHDTHFCDSLKLFLSHATSGTEIQREADFKFKRMCVEPVHDTVIVKPPTHDTVPVKPPVVVPPKTNCDSLRLQLSKLDTASADYARIKHLMGASCPVPRPVPVPVVPPKVNCDELRAKLAKMDSTSADFAHLLGSLRENCPAK